MPLWYHLILAADANYQVWEAVVVSRWNNLTLATSAVPPKQIKRQHPALRPLLWQLRFLLLTALLFQQDLAGMRRDVVFYHSSHAVVGGLAGAYARRRCMPIDSCLCVCSGLWELCTHRWICCEKIELAQLFRCRASSSVQRQLPCVIMTSSSSEISSATQDMMTC